jgi:transcriptional regulator with XRE-family HTH domain
VEDLRFGAALRSMRIARRWRQTDVAAAAGVADVTVSRIERGLLRTMSLRSIRNVAAVLEVSVELLPRSRAGSLDRTVNRAHALLAELVVRWISSIDGWAVRPEVSFSRYGERGSIDLLAWYPETGALLVIELKTEIVDIGELLGTFDRKLRNAIEVGRGLGWDAETASGLLVVGGSDVNRDRVAAHRATFEAAFPDRFVAVRRWLARPTGSIRGLVFFDNRHRGQPNGRVATVRRVRRARAPAVRAQSPG